MKRGLDEWNGYIEIFSLSRALEISRQYLLLFRTLNLEEKVVWVPQMAVQHSLLWSFYLYVLFCDVLMACAVRARYRFTVINLHKQVKK